MKKNKWIIWIIVFIVAVLLIFIVKKMIISAKQGGIIYGADHENGGIKGFVKNTGALLEVENNEIILNRKVSESNEIISCTGTPGGIASKINEMTGGVRFNDNANCEIKTNQI